VFVESPAHLAMNMATIMSYAAEKSTILTFLVTLPAARVLAQARQEAPGLRTYPGATDPALAPSPG
jgi:hypothetical protein